VRWNALLAATWRHLLAGSQCARRGLILGNAAQPPRLRSCLLLCMGAPAESCRRQGRRLASLDNPSHTLSEDVVPGGSTAAEPDDTDARAARSAPAPGAAWCGIGGEAGLAGPTSSPAAPLQHPAAAPAGLGGGGGAWETKVPRRLDGGHWWDRLRRYPVGRGYTWRGNVAPMRVGARRCRCRPWASGDGGRRRRWW
jgi:hypothetical protein